MDYELSISERFHDIYFICYLFIYSSVYLFKALSLSHIMHHRT